MKAEKACQHFLLDLNSMPRNVVVLTGFILGIVTMVIVDISQLAWQQPIATHVRQHVNQSSTQEEIKRLLAERDGSLDEDDDRLAVAVGKRVRVLCWIMIRQGQNVKVKAVQVTWGRRCDTLLYFGLDPEFSAIDVGVPEGKRFLAAKTFACLSYIYKHHLHDAEWFLKADDDTFIIMENLKYFLSDEDPNSPVYFGEYFNPYGSKYIHYNSGGGGYVMSREALRRYGEEGLNTSVCSDPAGPEDRAIGYCLRNIGVVIGNTTDRFGKTRFHYNQAAFRAVGNNKPWYKEFMGDRYKEGIDSMSTYPISFHYLQHYDIYVLDYILYRLRPYGFVHPIQEVNN